MFKILTKKVALTLK